MVNDSILHIGESTIRTTELLNSKNHMISEEEIERRKRVNEIIGIINRMRYMDLIKKVMEEINEYEICECPYVMSIRIIEEDFGEKINRLKREIRFLEEEFTRPGSTTMIKWEIRRILNTISDD
jgi:chromosome condensin MukBEF MukE localization factor